MADKHLSNSPHSIRGTGDVWWYEEPRGVSIYCRFEVDGEVIHPKFTIPWRSIRTALARKDKPLDG